MHKGNLWTFPGAAKGLIHGGNEETSPCFSKKRAVLFQKAPRFLLASQTSARTFVVHAGRCHFAFSEKNMVRLRPAEAVSKRQ